MLCNFEYDIRYGIRYRSSFSFSSLDEIDSVGQPAVVPTTVSEVATALRLHPYALPLNGLLEQSPMEFRRMTLKEEVVNTWPASGTPTWSYCNGYCLLVDSHWLDLWSSPVRKPLPKLVSSI